MANDEFGEELEVNLQSDLEMLRRIRARIGHVMLFVLQASGASLWARMYLAGRKPYNFKMLFANTIEGLEDYFREMIGESLNDS